MLGLQLSDTRVYREAKEEGRREGEAALVARRLKRRFGSVDEALAARVRGLEIDRLEALLDFTELSDLVIWLDRGE